MKIDFESLQNAVEVFGLIGLESKEDVKKRYYELSKKYHPDKDSGDEKKFQKINEAYKLLSFYMDHFKFRWSKEEFDKQYPFANDKEWSLW